MLRSDQEGALADPAESCPGSGGFVLEGYTQCPLEFLPGRAINDGGWKGFSAISQRGNEIGALLRQVVEKAVRAYILLVVLNRGPISHA
jgi:hypothetical protein